MRDAHALLPEFRPQLATRNDRFHDQMSYRQRSRPSDVQAAWSGWPSLKKMIMISCVEVWATSGFCPSRNWLLATRGIRDSVFLECQSPGAGWRTIFSVGTPEGNDDVAMWCGTFNILFPRSWMIGVSYTQLETQLHGMPPSLGPLGCLSASCSSAKTRSCLCEFLRSSTE